MHWFEKYPARLQAERTALESLQYEGWVGPIEWEMNAIDGSVVVAIDFCAGGVVRQGHLIYPFIYPSAPPKLQPRDITEWWSQHQWLTGELCLQIRPDTWSARYTGADILRSARELLDTEGTLDTSGRQGTVTSDHRFTEGQNLRRSIARLVLSDALLEEVARRGDGIWSLELRATSHIVSESETYYVFVGASISGSATEQRWIDSSIPSTLGFDYPLTCLIANVSPGDDRFEAITAKDMPPDERWAAFSTILRVEMAIVVGLFGGHVSAKVLGRNNVCGDVYMIQIDNQQRLPERNSVLAGKRVAILGCGSMGSKVAASLARMGVTDFFLIDDDVLKPGNLVRNALDWGDVGAHKVDALTSQLLLINSQVTVDKWANRLGGQTSNSALELCLHKLSQCNLIVETTGSGQGFLYASHVAQEAHVPMVWGRIFGGGFGGYMARTRPGLEASALDLRNYIYAWFAQPDFPPPPDAIEIDYAAGPDDQTPMIADDGDVSVISAHLTQFAADTLRPPSSSDYPNSAYVIGMRKEWIFDQPFDTRPIDVSEVGSTSFDAGTYHNVSGNAQP